MSRLHMSISAGDSTKERNASNSCAHCQGRTLMRVLAILVLALPVNAAATTPRVVVLPIEFLKADYFPDAHRISAAEQARLDLVADLIRARLIDEGYRVVSDETTRAAVAAADPGARLHECNGCERDIAADVDAEWVLVGWIQMVSNLIVNLNVVAYDVGSGVRVAQAFVDLRGNNERSWRRATQYMLDKILVQRLNAKRGPR